MRDCCQHKSRKYERETSTQRKFFEEEVERKETSSIFRLNTERSTISVVKSLYLINADADDKYQTGSISTYARQPWL